MTTDFVRYRISQALLFLAPATCLIVNPWGNLDPISVVKMTVVSSLAFLIFGLILYARKSVFDSSNRLLLNFSGFFVICMFSTLLFSGAPITQQIWGVFGRNTGLLTYLSLIVVVIAGAVNRDLDFFNKVVWSLILTGVPMTLYCFVQLAGKDPIGWSLKQAFGTLGNINFLSAFLGLVSIAASSLAIAKNTKTSIRILLIALVLSDLFVIKSTGSIQGLMMFAVGLSLIGFFWLGRFSQSAILRSIYSLGITGFGVLSVLGLANKGPLAGFLFQESNVLRTDYWHAGWQMTLDHPFFGVGMDSYGDWYREARGQISTLRGSPDRTANTAHNIFLDISSNGGFPLLIAYLAILSLAIRAIYRLYRRTPKNFEPIFVALSAVWVAYQVQALISINQVGVGIWGFLVTGALIGYEATLSINEAQSNTKSKKSKEKFRGKLLPASAGLAASFGFALGFLLAFPAINADSKFYAALRTRSIINLENATLSPGITAYHLGKLVDSASQASATENAKNAAFRLVAKFPRDFYAWEVIYGLPNVTPNDKQKALATLRSLDPFNPRLKVGN